MLLNQLKGNKGFLIDLIRKIFDDKEVFWLTLFRANTAVLGMLSVFLISVVLSQELQGILFTFYSLIAIQMFFELGASQAIIPIIGQLKQKLDSDLSGSALKSKYAKILLDYLRIFKRIFLLIAISFLVILIPTGYIFFNIINDLELSIFLYQWIVIVLATSITIYNQYKFSFLEGIGLLSLTYRVRFFQHLIGFVFLIFLLIIGGGLWAACAIPVTAAITSSIWLSMNSHYISTIRYHQSEDIISKPNWYKDVWPFQWRIAISWIAGYLSVQSLVPITFTFISQIDAGRLGLTILVFRNFVALAIAPLSSKFPKLSYLAQSNQFEFLRVYKKFLKVAFAFYILQTIIFLLFLQIFSSINPSLYGRFLDIFSSQVIFIFFFGELLVGCYAILIRAFKREIFAIPGLFLSLGTFFLALISSNYGYQVMLICITSYIALIGVPIISTIYLKFKRNVFDVRS